MKRRQEKKGNKFAMGALVGGIAAGVTALLFAPKEGKKLRKDISKKCHDLNDKCHDCVDDMKEMFKRKKKK